MKTSRFIKWQLKKWLPIILSLFLICAAIFWISMINIDVIKDTMYDDINGNPYPYYWGTQFKGGLLNIGILSTLITFVIPFFVFSYRFDKTGSDAYLQFPSKKNQIRNIKLLIGLGIVVSIITVVYWVGVLIVFARVMSFPAEGTWSYVNLEYSTDAVFYERYNINWNVYLYSYLFTLGSAIGTYFFNSLLVSLGNNFLTSAIYVIAGTLIVSAIGPFTFLYTDELIYVEQDVINAVDRFYPENFISGPIMDCIYIDRVLGSMIDLSAKNIEFVTSETLSMIFGWVARFGAVPLCIMLKDPSGEYFGQPGHKNAWFGFITYGAMFVIAIMVGTSFFGGLELLPIALFIIATVAFYLIVSIFNKNFKLGKKDIIPLASVTGAMFILSLIALVSF